MNGHLVAAAAATTISLSMVLSSVAYAHGTNTLTILALRFATLLVTLPLLARRDGQAITDLHGRARLAAWLLGAVFLCQTGGYLAAIVYIPVNLAVLLFYTYPVLTALLQAVLSRQAPRPLALLAALLALGGIALAMQVSLDGIDVRGVALALGGACAGAVVLVSNERLLRGSGPLQVGFHSSQGALLVCLAAAALGAPLALPAGADGAWAVAGAIGTFALAYPAMMVAIKRIGSVQTAMTLNLEPPVTIVLAAWLLDETMGPAQWLGALLVVGAVLLAQRAAGPHGS